MVLVREQRMPAVQKKLGQWYKNHEFHAVWDYLDLNYNYNVRGSGKHCNLPAGPVWMINNTISAMVDMTCPFGAFVKT